MSETPFGLPPFLFVETPIGQIWLILLVIGFLILVIIRMIKPKETEYKPINLRKEIHKATKQHLNDYSEKFGLKDEFRLTKGYNRIGIIKRMTLSEWVLGKKYNVKTKRIMVIKKEDVKKIKKKRGKPKRKPVFIFETYKETLFGKIKFFLGFSPTYWLVDNALVNKEGNYYNINPYAHFTNFLGLNLFTMTAKELIEDMSFKMLREIELNELINLTPRMVYLEGKSAKFAQKGEVLAKLDRKKKTGVQEGVIYDD